MLAIYAPDVLMLDGTVHQLEEQLQSLREAPETAGIRLVVAHAEEGTAPALQRAGAHAVLDSNTSAASLWRAVNETRLEGFDLLPTREPFGELALRDLCERVSLELQRGLLEASNLYHDNTAISFGEGTEIRAAIWSAVTTIREIVVAQSEGRIRFGPGPDGSTLLTSSARPSRLGHSLASSDSVDLTGRRIVVADDDPAVVWFVGGTLRAAGAEVREVQDGRRALNLVHQWSPELVVSDVLMPGLDGFALCREIKRDVVLRDVPVVLLSWKEDLLFRLRELGSDADGYLRKEAGASTLVDCVRELLWPKIRLEQRLRTGREVRGRLDGIATRSLIEAACQLDRNLRIALRDASAHFDIRIRDKSLRAITRTRVSGIAERGQAALSLLLGVSAGRFTVVGEDQPYEDDFAESNLGAVLRAPILRARAAQRVLSGAALGLVEQVTLDPDAFVDELSMLPLSLRPLFGELLRGSAPRQLLASGTASLQGLESLLSEAARRGAVRGILGPSGEDLLTREILALSALSSDNPPAGILAPAPLFTLQISPTPPPVIATATLMSPNVPGPSPRDLESPPNGFDWTAEASWEVDIPPEPDASTRAERSSPFSRPRLSAEWGSEKRTAPGVGTYGSTYRTTSTGAVSIVNAAQGHDVREASAPHVIPETLQKPPINSETPDLSRVVATALAAEPGAATQVLTLENQSDALNVQIRPIENFARSAPVIDFAEERETSPSAALSQPASRIEEEAIFPLFPSGAPSQRSRRNTPQPLVAVLPPASGDTLPSELSPRPAVCAEVADGPGTEVRRSAEDAGTQDFPDHSDSHSITAQQPPSTQEPEFATHSEDHHSNAVKPHDIGHPARARTNGWLVPLSLALTTGLLSFAVALPIVQRLRSTPDIASANSALGLESNEAPDAATATGRAPSRTLPADSARAVDPTEPSALVSTAAQNIDEAPTGVVIPPDKGLVIVKTGGVHSIFVDDEFIGRGPQRVVPLNPGQHKIRASLNGEEHTETVEVLVHRVVQLSLEQSGK
jgi:CheY-like chemotaxis protein